MQVQLIPVVSRPVGSSTVQTVNARELHAFLEIGKDFSTWINDRIKQFEFSEGVDFIKFPEIGESTSKPLMQYALTLDMAKELSMVERNAKGKQARQYFIECERVAKSAPALPTDPMAILKLTFDALEQSNKRIDAVEQSVTKMLDTVRLHHWQCHELKSAVGKKAYQFNEEYGIGIKLLYPAVWGFVKRHFQEIGRASCRERV